MSTQKNSLTIKDLVTTGIFSALCFILVLLGGVFFGANPVLTFWMPVGSALLAGPVFLLLIAKVPKHGPLTIVGVITGLIFFVTGMHWTMCVAYAVFGVGADLIVGAWKFKNIWLNILAYMLYSLAAIFPYVMFFFSRESYMSYLLAKGTDQAYLDTMAQAGQDWIFPVIVIGTLLVSFLSGLFGKKLLKKQFEKAGITA